MGIAESVSRVAFGAFWGVVLVASAGLAATGGSRPAASPAPTTPAAPATPDDADRRLAARVCRAWLQGHQSLGLGLGACFSANGRPDAPRAPASWHAVGIDDGERLVVVWSPTAA